MNRTFEYHFRNFFPDHVTQIDICIPLVTNKRGPYQIMIQTSTNTAGWTFHTDDKTRIAITKGNVAYGSMVRFTVAHPDGSYTIQDFDPLSLTFDISKALFSLEKLIAIAGRTLS